MRQSPEKRRDYSAGTFSCQRKYVISEYGILIKKHTVSVRKLEVVFEKEIGVTHIALASRQVSGQSEKSSASTQCAIFSAKKPTNSGIKKVSMQ